jgi:hypothetical protein
MIGRLTRWLLPSLPDLVFIGVLLLVLWLGSFVMVRDSDFGWHIATGRVIINTGSVPQTDLFSYTDPGRRYIPHEWLAEVIFALVFSAGGFTGLMLLTAGLIALTFAGLTAVLLDRGVSAAITLPLVTLGVLTSVAHWAPRPHIFTFLFTLIWATALERHRRSPPLARRPLGALWRLFPLLLIWVNLHGAFLIAFELTASYLAAALVMAITAAPAERAAHWLQARDLALLLALAIPITAINPVGFDLLRYSLDFVGQGYLRDIIPELQSPDFHDPLFAPLLALLAIALGVSVRRQLAPMILIVSWAAFTLISFRNIPQFVIICLPLIAESLQDLLVASAARIDGSAPPWLARAVAWARRKSEGFTAAARQARGGASALLGLAVVAALLAQGVRIDLWGGDYAFSDSAFPVRAVERMRPFPPGQRLFNDALWGGYFSFCCWPAVQNFVDGRVDMYGETYMREYFSAIAGEPGWRQLLDRYRVDWVMIAPDRPLARWLVIDPGWRELYRDGVAVVFVRADGK